MRNVLIFAAALAIAAGGAIAADKPQVKEQPKAQKMTEVQMARTTAAGYEVINSGQGYVSNSNVNYRGASAMCSHGAAKSATSTYCQGD
jgi:hypothetical protein